LAQTPGNLLSRPLAQTPTANKSFLLLFFKKEALAYLLNIR
jgi:hypothetical protein